MILAKTQLITFVEHFSSCGGHEYRPWEEKIITEIYFKLTVG